MDGEGEHIKNQIEAAFGADHECLYTLMGVTSTASTDEIKRSYRRMALKHHPDRGGDAEKFKALSAIHSILTDDDKRRVYDETGDVDGSGGHDMSEESFEFWDNYFRSMFPKVTVDDIESFAMLYKGSRGEVSSDHNERQDILDAYQQHGGRFDHIMECVMLAEEEDEPRITEIILAAIGSGDLAATPAFDKHVAAVSSKKTKKSRKREPSSSHSTEQGGIEERAGLSSRGSGKKKSKDKSDMGDLAAMILGNRNNQRGAMSSILARYGGGDGPADLGDYDISDEAFERTRASLLSSQQKTGKSSSKSTAGEKKKKQKQK